METKYEIYENNGGGLFLCILNNQNECTQIFENYEYARQPGILVDAIEQLSEDPTAYKAWDGDLMERIGGNITDVYGEISSKDSLVAWLYGAGNKGMIEPEHMGFAAQFALGVDPDLPTSDLTSFSDRLNAATEKAAQANAQHTQPQRPTPAHDHIH